MKKHRKDKLKIKQGEKSMSLLPYETRKRGYVYIMHDTVRNRYKIGRTKNLENRIKNLQWQYKAPIALVLSIWCKDSHKVETELHRRHRAYRLTGEWLSLRLEQLENIGYLIKRLNHLIE